MKAITRWVVAVILGGALWSCGGGGGGGGSTLALGIDTDGDGLPDTLELLIGSDPASPDSPFVGGNLDPNNATGPTDILPDGLENYLANNGAVIPVVPWTDTDGDGIPDYYEVWTGFDPFDDTIPLPTGAGGVDVDPALGPDGDGISDAFEWILASRGSVAPVGIDNDTDGDGIPDYFEVRAGGAAFDADDPLVGGGGGADVANTGPEGDGISDALEFLLIFWGAPSPLTSWIDTDTDGIPDGWEVLRLGSFPFSVNNPVVNGSDDIIGTGPGGDGIPDGLEHALVEAGTLTPVAAETDSDTDGVPDHAELKSFTDFFDRDDPVVSGDLDVVETTGPAGDGISDALEQLLINGGATAPVGLSSDSDADGVPDYAEIRGAYVSDPFDGDKPVVQGGQDVIDSTGPAGDGISDALEQYLINGGAVAPVTVSTDSDFDGLPDHVEVQTGSDPFDWLDPSGSGLDANGNGIPDNIEAALVAGGAVPPITARTDTDGDGVPGYFEIFTGSNAFDEDSPIPNGGNDINGVTGNLFDGISDALEWALIQEGASAPVTWQTDTDGDGIPDAAEVFTASGAMNVDDPVTAGNLDTDDGTGPAGDGIPDGLEAHLISLGAAAPVNPMTDTDGDGIPDHAEVRGGHDMQDGDDPIAAGGADVNNATGPSGDGISDALEQYLINNGSPAPVAVNTDTDGDGLADYIEVRTGTDPFDPASPGAGPLPDVDQDGVADWFEALHDTDPYDANSPVVNGGADVNDATGPSGDGISDALEQILINCGAVAPVTTTTDSDNDGTPDYLEVWNGTDPHS